MLARPWSIGEGGVAVRISRARVEPPTVEVTAIVRPRLEQLISGLIETHRVVVVTATAGAGKTTAVAQTLSHWGRPSAWLSLQRADRQPGRLVTFLAAALSEVDDRSYTENVASALSSRLSPAETSEYLGELVPDEGWVVVLDNAEVLAHESEAVAVVTAFAQALPRSATLLICSRVSLPLSFEAPNSPVRVGAVDEKDLAFSSAEAGAALSLIGATAIDAETAVRLTGGWVAGVLFEAWRADAHVAGLGGETDPLHGYLATEVLARLDDSARGLLVITSVLDVVTVESARSLGLPDATSTMVALRSVRLPIAWIPDELAFRCHPRFREFLQQELDRRPDDQVRAVRLAHGRFLSTSARFEDAATALFQVGAIDEAREAAQHCILDVVLRSDLATAEQWLSKLDRANVLASPTLVEAELLLAHATEDYGRGAQTCDDLLASTAGRQLVAQAPRIVALAVWLFLHRGRLDSIREVLRLGGTAPEIDVIRYAIVLVDSEAEGSSEPPALTGSVFDALAMRTHFDFGRLELLLEIDGVSPWVARAAAPWRVAALLATGRLDQAHMLAGELSGTGHAGTWLAEVVAPKLVAETGDVQGALSRLVAGRQEITRTGSVYRLLLSLLTEAELRLRHDAAPERVHDLFRLATRHEAGRRFANFREELDMLMGLAMLREDRDALAVPALQRAVESMQEGGRFLWLPAAAVYLAEALWRVGDPVGADDAASSALLGAAAQGTNHGLLQALALFPEVLSRRLDSEPTSDSEWHRLGRSLVAITGSRDQGGPTPLRFIQFGRLSVTVDGVEAPVSLRKAFELLAVLAEAGPEGMPRERIIAFLFGDHRDQAAATYLRQAALKLRRAVPGVLPAMTEGSLRLGGDVFVDSESSRLGALQRQAASARGAARLDAVIQAISIAEQGEFMPGCSSPWVVQRRSELALQVLELRADAAVTAEETGQYGQADNFATAVLDEDPFRESLWQVRMRSAAAFGDHDAVTRLYRECAAALKSIGTKPSATTAAVRENQRR